MNETKRGSERRLPGVGRKECRSYSVSFGGAGEEGGGGSVLGGGKGGLEREFSCE